MITAHSPASAWTLSGCPASPAWTLDWPDLREYFAFLAPLACCPQDPLYHAEGDVLIHTGKGTWLRRHGQGHPVISLDALRADLAITPAARQGPVIEAAMAQARVYLRAGQSFIWNATNLRRSTRARLINLFLDYEAQVRIVYLEAPWATVLRRNAARPAPVPDGVLRRMAGDLEVPDLAEAHEVEWIDTGS